MKLVHPWWLAGTGLAVALAVLLVLGGLLLVRRVRRFGDEARVTELTTARAAGRRAVKGSLLVVAVALLFVGLARPQYGRGTRLVPATNLDVVVLLDYSKSMYARDVTPSRIDRAKVEVGQLIASLPGARFGAVAFAGEPMSFPLTSDGAAIAQFFRQLEPNDMPVGGTAIARALEAGRELLQRDPRSTKHRKVMVLITDGEDLEGDPVAVARGVAAAGVTLHVVQIGGRSPEAIPQVDESGKVSGWRRDAQGLPLTTQLTASGEAQLAQIASTGGGSVVRSEQGSTGIREIQRDLARTMTEELSERVETVYADVYPYPVGLGALLLLAEVFVAEARTRRRVPGHPAAGAASLVLAVALLGVLTGCSCEDTSRRLFERYAPPVDDAVEALDAGDLDAAVGLLESYLSTGQCQEGQLGTPDRLRERPSASFDLGLTLFRVGERFGKRFGLEQEGTQDPNASALLAKRSSEVDCALRVVRIVASLRDVAVELRARAHYLSGNLEFLRGSYRDAVSAYDEALLLVPGDDADGGDGVGRDAAYNRAIALRRLEEEERAQDAGSDATPPQGDGGDQRPDGGSGGPEGGSGSGDSGTGGDDDAGGDGDSGAPQDRRDGGASPRDPHQKPDPKSGQQGEPQPQPQQPPGPSLSQDERVLDMLEHAPTLQQENAKQRARRRVRITMEDK